LGERNLGKSLRAEFAVAKVPFAESPWEIELSFGYGWQAALGAADTSGNRPFFKRLAAVRCAFRWVASIISRRGLPPLRASVAKSY
jgi:hypothetical protein